MSLEAWFAHHYRGVSIGTTLEFRPYGPPLSNTDLDERCYARLSVELASSDEPRLERVQKIVMQRFPYLEEEDHYDA